MTPVCVVGLVSVELSIQQETLGLLGSQSMATHVLILTQADWHSFTVPEFIGNPPNPWTSSVLVQRPVLNIKRLNDIALLNMLPVSPDTSEHTLNPSQWCSTRVRQCTRVGLKSLFWGLGLGRGLGLSGLESLDYISATEVFLAHTGAIQIRWLLLLLLSLTPARSRYSIYLPRRDGKLSWPRWLVTYRDGLSVHRWSPVQVLSQQCTTGSRTRDIFTTCPTP